MSEPISIRLMTVADVPLGMRLKEAAGWNQTEADWLRFLLLQPDGCFVAVSAGQDVGTVTTFIFGNVAWIAMVLVDEQFRKQGIGTALMNHALAFLGNRTIRLDATALGQPVYEKLGFVSEYQLARFEGQLSGGAPQPGVTSAASALVALDQRVTGTPRAKLLKLLAGATVRVVGSTGYLIDRPGSLATHIGPAIAVDEATGLALLSDAAYRLSGRPVFIDIPVANQPAVKWAEAAGLKVQRTFLRMRRGPAIADHPRQIWASSGPEKG